MLLTPTAGETQTQLYYMNRKVHKACSFNSLKVIYFSRSQSRTL